MHATLIAEDFAGMWSQGRGLAERVGFSWERQPIFMRKGDVWQCLPARLWPSPLKRVEPFVLSPKTDVIISLGGRGGIIGAALGKHYGLPVIQVQNPRTSLEPYAVVIAHHHDQLEGKNVFLTRTALHGVTEDVLKQAFSQWKAIIRTDEKPVLGVLLGGSNGRFRFDVSEAAHIAQQLGHFIRQRNVSCVITPSRRTSPEALTLLKTELEPLGGRFLEGTGQNNPYMGVLACSDMLAVTMDSVSMISEAVATSLPVGILPLSGHSKRIAHFIKMLEKQGRVHSFSADLPLETAERLDDTSLAAEEIRRYMKL